MNKSILKGLLLGATALLLTVPALAQGGPDCRGPNGGPCLDGDKPPIERALERLDLTEDQRAEIDAIVSGSRESVRGKAEQLRERREQMRQLLEADPLDEGAFRSASRQAAELEADLTLERVRTMKNVKAQLTAEQLTELEGMRERRGEMRRGDMRRGGARGPGAGRRPRGGNRDLDE